MSAQPSYQNDKAEEYARWRRRDHANIESVQNLAIAGIAEESGVEMPPNVRHLVSAIQGAHGGGEVAYEEFARDYLSIGKQLQFSGTDEAVRARVRRWVDDLISWQHAGGYELFAVHKGGGVIGYRPDGSPIRKKTVFIDQLKPKADEAVQRARKADEWKRHPGKALEAQVASLLKTLPRIKPEKEKEKGEGARLPLDKYETTQEELIGSIVEKRAEEIERRGGDGAEWVDRVANNLYRLAASLKKTAPARRDFAALSIFDEEGEPPPPDSDEAAASATSYVCNKKADFAEGEAYEVDEVIGAELGDKNVTQLTPEPAPAQQVSEAEKSENAEPMLNWALFWAEKGIPVFPLHEVYDGTCTCTCTDHWRKKEGKWVMLCEGNKHFCGGECGNKGKHPRTDRKIGLQNGLKIASTDPEKIKVWWGRYPAANLGGRMLGKLGIDVDPKHGGNAAIHDLCEKYGQEWLDGAWRNASGSGGDHFIFDNKTGVPFQNSASRIGPGIDTRGDEGYLVMPPSLHVSGQRYAVISPSEFPPVPQFIIDALNAPKSESEVVFQDRSARGGVGNSSEKFLDGHRNDGLLAYGLGRMRYAWERTEDDHCSQLSRVNQLRCVPPLDDDEVRNLAAHIAADYAHLYGANVGEKGKAA